MELANKRLVILGCGYLGSRVARQALEKGMEVTALTRNPVKGQELGKLGVHQVVTAELDRTDWHALINPRQDLVLNCVSSGGGGVEGYRKSYLEGMRSLLTWAEAGDVGTILFTSSTSVYGQDRDVWVDETSPAEGSSDGSRVLRGAEALLETATAAASRRFVFRLGGIYGPGRQWLVNRAMGGDVPEEGDEVYLNSIHVDDAVSAIWRACEGAPSVGGGVFNIVDDSPTRKGEIVRYLKAQLKARGLLPSAAGSSPLPTRRRRGARPSRRLSNAKAREVLGWKPHFPDYRAGYESVLAEMAKAKAKE